MGALFTFLYLYGFAQALRFGKSPFRRARTFHLLPPF